MREIYLKRKLWLPPMFIAWISAGMAVAQEPASANRIVREGIDIEFQMESVEPDGGETEGFREGDRTRFRFKISDTNTGTPLSGVFPAAWMDRLPEKEESGAETCQDKVQTFIGGGLLAPPELDLNVYYVLALNDDATISVVDPLFGFGTTKLLDMIFLKSPGEDWTLNRDQSRLFVSMPASNQVAVADTTNWEVTSNLDVGPSPSRVALQPDGHFLWVAYDTPKSEADLSGVTVIDARNLTVAKDILTGKGHHEIAFSKDNRFAFITNPASGTLSVIDIRKLEKIKDVPVGKDTVSMAFSAAADAVYVVDGTDGTIAVVDAENHQIMARMKAESGLGQIKFAPGGRLGFVVNHDKNLVHILDASLNRIIQTADVEEGPDQIAFSDELAYVRHRDSEIVLMIPLDQVGQEGQPVPLVDFTGGQVPFGRVSRPSPADGIVQAPGATAVLVANPVDRAIYFYKEGMAAPMGQFQNYGRQPRAVLAVDRSFRESIPGSYETTATLRRPGPYHVALFLDSPRTIHCFPVTVAPSPELEAERRRLKAAHVEATAESRDLQVGETVTLTFKLSDPTTQEPLKAVPDLRILTFAAPGIWQKRHRVQESGEGVYQLHFAPPTPGVYYVFAASQSLGLTYNKSPFLTLRVKEQHAN
ncbi:MAG: cytochrome D1 [Acidobacteriota bacterium]